MTAAQCEQLKALEEAAGLLIMAIDAVQSPDYRIGSQLRYNSKQAVVDIVQNFRERLR